MNKVTTVHSAIRMQSSRNRNLLKPSGRARLLIGYDGPCNRERLVRQREGRLEPATFYLLGHFDYLLGQLAPVLNMLKASDREREPEREGRINIKKKRESSLYIDLARLASSSPSWLCIRRQLLLLNLHVRPSEYSTPLSL